MVSYYLEDLIMFKQYTGIQYMAIDIANHFGEVVIDTEMYDMLTI